MLTPTQSCLTASVRWMDALDLPALRTIEADSPCPLGDVDFLAAMRRNDAIANVAEVAGLAIGYSVHVIAGRGFYLDGLGVHPSWRRCGVGKILVSALKRRLHPERNRIVADVRERDLGTQLFFQRQGFIARRVLNDYFADDRSAAFRFVFRQEFEPPF